GTRTTRSWAGDSRHRDEPRRQRAVATHVDALAGRRADPGSGPGAPPTNPLDLLAIFSPAGLGDTRPTRLDTQSKARSRDQLASRPSPTAAPHPRILGQVDLAGDRQGSARTARQRRTGPE